MTIPIQAAPPVNPVITIQPVTTTIPNRDSTPGTNPLANVASGTLVEGFVVNRDAQSNPILRTPLGDLRITSEVFLKTGSEVVFRVDTSQSSLARIVTVDGLTPQDYSAQASRGLTQDTISPSSLQPAAPNALAQAAKPGLAATALPQLQAIILQPTPQSQAPSLLAAALSAAQSGPASVLTQLSQLRSGAVLKLSVLDLKLPPLPVALASVPESETLSVFLPPRPTGNNPATTPNSPTPTREGSAELAPPITGNTVASNAAPENAAPAAPPTAANAPQATQASNNTAAPASLPSTLTQPTPQGTAVAAATPGAIAAHAGAAAPVPPPAALTPAVPELARPTAPNQIVASVIGHDADGANILHTPFASLKIYTPQPLPTGTTLLLAAQVPAAGAAEVNTSSSTAQVTQPFATSTSPAQPLASIGDALNWLSTNQPDVARDVQARLPALTHQLASSLLSYIAGIKIGDAAEIIGKRALRQLELHAPDILGRLRQQVEQLQSNFIDSPLPHWSALPLPLLFGGELHTAQLYVGKEPPESQGQAGGQSRGQRFILEVGMSQLGPLQFDGFVREGDRAKSFDLMVRSAQPLSEDITSGIRNIFTSSLEVTGLRGQMIFQHGEQHFVRPLAEAPRVLGDGTNTILA